MNAVLPEPAIRRMTAADLPRVCQIVGEFDPALVSEARGVFLADLERDDEWPRRRCRLVAECGENVVGTMGYGVGALPSDGVMWTDWLMVSRAARRGGVATALYLALEDLLRETGCEKVYLDVGTVYKQPDAIAFHARHGYRIEGILQDYWGAGEDLVVMAKRLVAGSGGRRA